MDALFLPAWISFLVGVVLFFVRKWVGDVAASIAALEDRMRAHEKAQADCRLEFVRGYPTRPELERLEERVDNHTTRLTILEERYLDA